MNLAEAVGARRSVRSFEDRPVSPEAITRAIGLAVQAPAPHHSAPWRFAVLEEERMKAEFSRAMGVVWHADLMGDGMPEAEVEAILSRSHQLLTSTPTLVVCCADMARAHVYKDARRERAEWTLFAHSVGAALQTFMTSLAADGIASCWISAPAFCGDTVKDFLGLAPHVEPQALVLVGYASPDYKPRPRPEPNPADYLIPH